METNNINFSEKLKSIIENNWFEYFILIVIIFAGIIVGLQSFSELKDNYTLKILDEIILGIFILEIILRIGAEGKHWTRFFYYGKINGWHIFDIIVVGVCLIPYFTQSGHTEYFAVLRLARILRIVKLFEQIKRLKALIDSLMNSLPSLSYVMILLILLFYIYGVLGTDLFGKYAEEEFGNLFASMRSLFFVSTEGWSWVIDSDGGPLYQAIKDGNISEFGVTFFFISFFSLGAMIILNLLIGIITSEVDETKEAEKLGKSKAGYKNHTVILGWSQQIIQIIKELIQTNSDNSIPKHIVIMSEKDKLEMESEIKNSIHYFGPTKLHYRTGKSTDLDDLNILNLHKAKSIIILSDETISSSDNYALKVVMAIKHTLNLDENKIDKNNFSSYFPYLKSIVVQIVNNHTIQDIIRNEIINGTALENKLTTLPYNTWISKIIAQTSLQPGLSKIYKEIFGFSGSELYLYSPDDIKNSNLILNKNLKEISLSFKESYPLGILSNDGAISFNLNSDLKLTEESKLIIIAEDTNQIKLKNNIVKNEKSINKKLNFSNENVNILLLGWNSKVKNIITEIFKYSNKNLSISLALNNKSAFYKKAIKDLNSFIFNSGIKLNNYTNIDKIKSNLNLESSYSINLFEFDFTTKKGFIDFFTQEHTVKFNRIILLSNYEYSKDIQESDSETLISLIHFRTVFKDYIHKAAITDNCSIVTEMIDVHNMKIAELSSSDNKEDFIIGADIISGITAQLSENIELELIFEHIFMPEGQEIYLQSINDFADLINLDNEISLDEIIQLLSSLNDNNLGTAFGYIINDEIFINPDRFEKVKFSSKDNIVLFKDEHFHLK